MADRSSQTGGRPTGHSPDLPYGQSGPGLDYKGEESCLPSTTTYIFVNHLTLICA
jgi:hypothetical protein